MDKRKIERAIKLLRSASKIAGEHGQPLEIAYSGGKDSDVILQLARMSGVEYRAIYKNTTIDPSGTIKHVRDNGVEVLQPAMNFQQIIAKKGFPNRWRRFCCRVLKEYKILDYAVIGVRRDESRSRADRYQEPEQCRTYEKGVKVRQYFPILDWTMQDVSEFVKEQGIQCHPLYYDEDGNFHPERRLGCMCCPIKSRQKRIIEFKQYPRMLRFYIRGGQKYIDTHKDSKNVKKFDDVYKWLTMDIFCDSYNEFIERFGVTLFDNGIDCKQFLMDYFKIEL